MSLTDNLNKKNINDKKVYGLNFSPLVHILLPVYNHKNFLRLSIESVLNQDYKNLRLLILNDGSTEEIQPILEEFKSDQRVRIFHEENVGLPGALTKLYHYSLSEAYKPSFITWHSADNYYEHDAISQMVNFLTNNYDIGITYANVRLINDKNLNAYDSEYRKNDQFLHDNSIINLSYLFESISEFNDNFVNACFLVRSNSEVRIPCFSEKHKGFEDYIRWLKLSLLTRGSHIGLDRPLYNYRLHQESLTEELKDSSLPKTQYSAVKKTKILKDALTAEQIPFKLQTSNSLFNIPTKVEKNHSLISKQIIKLLSKGDINIAPVLHGIAHELFAEKPTALRLSKIAPPIHRSHEKFFSIPPLDAKLISPAKTILNSWIFSGTINLPFEIARARDRELGMFNLKGDDDNDFRNRLLIFTPTSEKHNVLEQITDFIINSKNELIILYCASADERKIADNIFLGCKCGRNVRIVDEKSCIDKLQSKPTGLLNALGSSDAIISISNFFKYEDSFPEQGLTDYIMESIYSSLSKRPLIINSNFILRNNSLSISPPLTVSIPNILTLSNNLLALNLETSNQALDSYLSQFIHTTNFTQLIAAALIEEIK